MTIQELAPFIDIALAIAMISLPIWLPRYFKDYMSQPGGKRIVVWLIIALEAMLAAYIIDAADHGFWSVKDLPLVLPCFGALLWVGGVSGTF